MYLTPQQQIKVSLAMQRVAKLVDKELRKAAGVFVPNLGRTFQAEAPNLGRALLIATLNALIAESN